MSFWPFRPKSAGSMRASGSIPGCSHVRSSRRRREEPLTSRRTPLLALVLAVLILPLANAPSARAGGFPNSLDAPEGATSLGPVVLENHVIHNIYVDGSWDDDNPGLSMASIDGVTQRLVDSDYFNAASQYGVSDPSFSGSDEKGGDVCGFLPIIGGLTSAGPISTWLACELAQVVPNGPTAGGFDPPAANSLYMVYLPKNTPLVKHH